MDSEQPEQQLHELNQRVSELYEQAKYTEALERARSRGEPWSNAGRTGWQYVADLPAD
jgi:hypothetical protein